MTRPYRFLVLVLVGAASPASAQSVRVRAREEGTAHVAVGALVTLRDSLGKALAQALTDAAGSAILSAPNAGTYFLRIDRIGFSGIMLGPFQLVAGDTLGLSAVVPNVRVTLPELSVMSGTEAKCELAADASEAIARIWGEAQKALTVSELADSTMAVLEVTKYERELGSVEGTYIADSAHREVVRSNRPFIAADPVRLAKTGFREPHGSGYVYYAPDARVLLSDAFLAQHCFGPAPPSTEPGLVGLAFFPMAKYRKRTDVTGALWLDRATSELRSLDFQYTNVDKRIASGKEGGRIEFMRLPRGELIVGRWRVRVGFMERGGEVAVIRGEGAGDGAWVVGIVFDSLADRPLSGAVVSVSNGPADTTRADGTYRLAVPSTGQFTIEVDHPLLAFLDATRSVRASATARGQEVRADIATPSVRTLAGRVCPHPGAELRDNGAVLFGTVADSLGAGRAATVVLSWDRDAPLRAGSPLVVTQQSVELTANTDSFGRFWICGLPGGIEIRVRLADAPAVLAASTIPAGRGTYLKLIAH